MKSTANNLAVKEDQIVYILLPVYNRRSITLNFIELLLKQDYKKIHLVLIDDGSIDGTADSVKKRFCNLTIIEGDGNLWWSGSLQKGVNWLKDNCIIGDEVVLIMNDDVEFESDFISNGLRILCENPGVFLTAHGLDVATGAPRDTGVYKFNFEKFVFTEVINLHEINCSSTRGLMTRASDFLDVGGFYPKLLPHYLSDLEFTMRALKMGKKLVSDKNFGLKINFKTSGYKVLNEKSFDIFLKKSFSKRSAMNPIYWSSFVILRSPIRYIPINISRIWGGFFMACLRQLSLHSKLNMLIRKMLSNIRSLW